MSRTATGAVLVSCLLAFLAGPELGFGPITSTSRADERHTPAASVIIIHPPNAVWTPPPAPPAPAPPARASRSGVRSAPAAVGGDVWARLRACESPTGASGRYRGYYQSTQSRSQSA